MGKTSSIESRLVVHRKISCEPGSHGMRNEIAARRRCSMKRLRERSRSHRFLANDVVEVPLHCRKHGCNEGPSRAISFERYISLRIPWDIVLQMAIRQQHHVVEVW
jgi:hypothetical protein